jgi:hypothetical protein
MPKTPVRVQPVDVAAPDAATVQVALRFQVGDDRLHGPLGDPDPRRDVAQPTVRVAGDREEDVGVVGQEGPLRVAAAI